MNILAFETATSACSAALWQDGEIVAQRLEIMARGQSEALMPMVLEVMNQANCDFQSLDLLAVTTGPGAFTGLRIGLAAAHGMAIAHNLSCLGVNTLETIAYQVDKDERAGKTLLVALETKRNDVYAQTFDSDLKALCSPSAIAVENLLALVAQTNVILAGDASSRVAKTLTNAGIDFVASNVPGFAHAANVAEIAAKRWHPGATLLPPVALYLKPPDVTLPKNTGRSNCK